VAAARLHRHLPSVRLVFILREPAERAWSNYRWSKANGLEDLGFAAALEREEEREAACPEHLRFSRPHAYFSRGRYADLLAPYFDLFGPEAILVLRYEDIAADPGELAARLHAFLGIAPRPDDAAAVGVVNPAPAESAPREVMAALRKGYEEPNRRLHQLLGEEFRPWE
jgi:hypothetical protein